MTDASRPVTPTAPSPARKAPPGILAGPISPTVLRLALPTITVLVVQTLVGVAETYLVSFLGTDALAGVAVVVAAQFAFTCLPPLQAVFETRPATLLEGLSIVGLGVVFLLTVETGKWLAARLTAWS